ncbi:unnamed protein product [Candidula unifasciata]|uniref:N-acetyltransferase domain-containing protein n=1 Tax=Candidula unifasciata TaxID=100452 RepID=A0A8S4ADC3_9EUPU|nr:unnamed protein product [Candidula unifasciata]
MEVVPLHKHPKLTDACAEILNAYWPRSKAARSHVLSKSCDQLPVCLAFIQQDGSQTEVLGFSKLSAVQGIPNACLVESVIVREMDRGRGLGKVLMNLTEDYARRLGMRNVYLNTIDKEGFYARIGYVRCSPVISLGDNAHRVPEALLKKLMGTSSSLPDTTDHHSNVTLCQPPSGTPSLLENRSGNDNTTTVRLSSCESNCEQTVISITPPAPPPPPPPTNNCSHPTAPPGSYSRAIIRMNPNFVVWMKKDL